MRFVAWQDAGKVPEGFWRWLPEVPEFAVVAVSKFAVVAVVSDGWQVRGSTSVYRCSHLPPDQLDLPS